VVVIVVVIEGTRDSDNPFFCAYSSLAELVVNHPIGLNHSHAHMIKADCPLVKVAWVKGVYESVRW
jgi:hypothetical protein